MLMGSLFASANGGLVLIKKWKKVNLQCLCCGAAYRFPPMRGSCILPQHPGTLSHQLLALEIAVVQMTPAYTWAA